MIYSWTNRIHIPGCNKQDLKNLLFKLLLCKFRRKFSFEANLQKTHAAWTPGCPWKCRLALLVHPAFLAPHQDWGSGLGALCTSRVAGAGRSPLGRASRAGRVGRASRANRAGRKCLPNQLGSRCAANIYQNPKSLNWFTDAGFVSCFFLMCNKLFRIL